ncbi:TPA: hypothetical protein ACIYX1_004865 [Escherichia coli]|nr:hypothetical protein [Escherichia coli]
MKVLRNKKYLWPGILLCGCMAFQVSAADVEFQMRYTQLTCNLTFDNGQSSLNYSLGNLSPGQRKKHVPFTVIIDCPEQGNTALKTAIKANLTEGGRVRSGGRTALLDVITVSGVTEPGNIDTTPLFWLETNDGKKVSLRNDEIFCTRIDTTQAQPNRCQLTPVTEVPAQALQGELKAVVQMTVAYPQ